MKHFYIRTKDKYATVDDEDYEMLKAHSETWSAASNRSGITLVARSKILRKTVTMGRLILGLKNKDGKQCDHIDRDPFNNTRLNLRVATLSQNQANKSLTSRNTSGYKGVTFEKDRNKWKAVISINNQQYNLGRFFSKEQAARAYNEAALKYYGQFAVLNSL